MNHQYTPDLTVDVPVDQAAGQFTSAPLLPTATPEAQQLLDVLDLDPPTRTALERPRVNLVDALTS